MYHRLFSEKAIFFFTGEEQVNTVSHDPILPPHGHTSHEFETVLVMSHFPFVLYVSPPFLRRGGGVFFFETVLVMSHFPFVLYVSPSFFFSEEAEEFETVLVATGRDADTKERGPHPSPPSITPIPSIPLPLYPPPLCPPLF